ncbi:ABC transporter permease [Acetobacter oeni]|nr:ABC transporter permease [Acetobacter oeni]NHO18090.1 ABC transporter permease [Acetobacter oeni]
MSSNEQPAPETAENTMADVSSPRRPPVPDEPELRSEIAAQGPEPVLDLRPEKGFAHIRHAARDFRDGFALFRLGWTLGWLDIKLRYRGSMLGPFWMTISTAILVGSMGVLYATLFHIELRIYLPFLSFSLILWAYLNTTVSDGCATFTSSSGLIHAMRMPFSLHVLRVTVRNFLTFLHSVGVIALVFIIFRIAPVPDWQIPAGLVLWGTDLYAITLLTGVLGARFRDMPPVTASIMQILFFVTPVLWKPDLIYAGRQYMLLDPCYPLIEIIRGPFMGLSVRPSIWLVAVLYSIALWIVSFSLFARMRARLAYWV